MDGETEWRMRAFDPTPEEWCKLHADPRRGPVYPALPGVEKWRRLNWGRDLTPYETREYGRAVLAAIHALNHAGLQRVKVDLRCTAWKPNPAVAKLAKLADEAVARRIASGNVEKPLRERERLARLKAKLLTQSNANDHVPSREP